MSRTTTVTRDGKVVRVPCCSAIIETKEFGPIACSRSINHEEFGNNTEAKLFHLAYHYTKSLGPGYLLTSEHRIRWVSDDPPRT